MVAFAKTSNELDEKAGTTVIFRVLFPREKRQGKERRLRLGLGLRGEDPGGGRGGLGTDTRPIEDTHAAARPGEGPRRRESDDPGAQDEDVRFRHVLVPPPLLYPIPSRIRRQRGRGGTL